MENFQESQSRVITFHGKIIPLDEDGHLVNAEDWSEELADYLAKIDGITLTEEHWEVIRFIKSYYERFTTGPMPKIIIKRLNKKHGRELYSVKKLYTLFTTTPMRRACLYAGVPQTAGCT